MKPYDNPADHEKLGAVGEGDTDVSTINSETHIRLNWTWTGKLWIDENHFYIRASNRLTNFRLLKEGYTPPLEEPTKFPALIQAKMGTLWVSNGEKDNAGQTIWRGVGTGVIAYWQNLTVTKIYEVGE